jgi:hypothetical protein
MYLQLNNPEIIPIMANFVRTGNIDLFFFTEDLIIDINTQVVLLTFFVFLSVLPMMYALDKFLRNRPNVPIFKLTLFGMFGLILPVLVVCFIVNRIYAPSGSTLAFTGCPWCWQNFVLMAFIIGITIIFFILIRNFVIFYIQLAIKLPKGAPKTKTSLIAGGILLMYLGLFGANLLKNSLNGTIGMLMGPVVFIISLLILFAGFNMKD